MTLDQSLYKVPATEYGDQYHSHLIEQYKLYVQMADKISERRQSTNSFFLTVNTALIAFLGIVAEPNVGSNPSVTANPPLPWALVISAAGVILCYSWYRLVRSYKGPIAASSRSSTLLRPNSQHRCMTPSGKPLAEGDIASYTSRSPTSSL